MSIATDLKDHCVCGSNCTARRRFHQGHNLWSDEVQRLPLFLSTIRVRTINEWKTPFPRLARQYGLVAILEYPPDHSHPIHSIEFGNMLLPTDGC